MNAIIVACLIKFGAATEYKHVILHKVRSGTK